MTTQTYVAPTVGADALEPAPRTDAWLGEVGGFRVILETFRFDPTTHQIWLLGMGGQATAVRGAWAQLFLGAFVRVGQLTDDAVRKLGGSVEDEDSTPDAPISTSNDDLYSLAGGSSGWTAPQARPGHDAIGRTMIHLLMLPPCVDLPLGPDTFLLVEDDRHDLPPSTLLLHHLVARSSPPIVAEWEADLWDWATRSGHVTELAGIGRWCYLAHIPDNVLIQDFIGKRVAVQMVESDDGDDAADGK